MRKYHKIFRDILADAKQNGASPWDGLCLYATKMRKEGKLSKKDSLAAWDYMSERLESIQEKRHVYLVSYLMDKHPDVSKEEIKTLWYQWYENEINTLKEWEI